MTFTRTVELGGKRYVLTFRSEEPTKCCEVAVQTRPATFEMYAGERRPDSAPMYRKIWNWAGDRNSPTAQRVIAAYCAGRVEAC
jgi:hypothetical protein